ncbi:MAG TPA: 1-acyl-sn-glycerol-3-phosphate acyltransferase [Myxococcaceae bacterium]|nr:1-acyl-sn-glycerol-3-phosphate acyltransferase [Myxococcaceae bacterium]
MPTSSERPSSIPTPTGVDSEARPAPPTEHYAPRFVLGLRRGFWPFARLWFRPRLSGWQHVPEGPFLCVANHSGYGVGEVLTLLCLWVGRFGTERPAVGLAHDLGLWWPFRIVVLPIGGVRASVAAGREALARGFPVLVFPGGDIDALRPFAERDRVTWGGRHGFLRVARDAQVPLVPLVIAGSHAQYTLLPGGPIIARVLGLRRVRLATWPLPFGGAVLLAAAVAWVAGLLPGGIAALALVLAFLPNPSRIEYRFLPAEAPPPKGEEGAELASRAETLRQRMEAVLGEMERSRRTPWG